MQDKYEAVIGLEVHTQLKTKTKLFCSCRNRFGDEPNTNTCPLCLGMPGVLPVLNRQAMTFGTQVGLGLNCKINEVMKFDRKNYFYPDLPKAYQISQFDMPIAYEGHLTITTKEGTRDIRINRAHMEEDAGKLLHEGIKDGSNVDYNRGGTPLIEIVSEPDMHSSEGAYQYLSELKAILQYLDVSDCNMEEGSLRCDANVSVRLKGETKLGTKAEVKNLNSFKAVAKAIDYEIARQIDMVENNEKVQQETRLWDEKKETTKLMRSKEGAHDYRYFPEPDLVPFHISREFVKDIADSLPELPNQRLARFKKEYGLSDYDAGVLVQEKPLSEYYEEVLSYEVDAKAAFNIIANEILGQMKGLNMTLESLTIKPVAVADLVKIIQDGTISTKIAKDVVSEMFNTDQLPSEIVKEKGLVQISDDSALIPIIQQAISECPGAVEDIKNGKEKAVGQIVGRIMKATQGKANPGVVNKLILEQIHAS